MIASDRRVHFVDMLTRAWSVASPLRCKLARASTTSTLGVVHGVQVPKVWQSASSALIVSGAADVGVCIGSSLSSSPSASASSAPGAYVPGPSAFSANTGNSPLSTGGQSAPASICVTPKKCLSFCRATGTTIARPRPSMTASSTTSSPTMPASIPAWMISTVTPCATPNACRNIVSIHSPSPRIFCRYSGNVMPDTIRHSRETVIPDHMTSDWFSSSHFTPTRRNRALLLSAFLSADRFWLQAAEPPELGVRRIWSSKLLANASKPQFPSRAVSASGSRPFKASAVDSSGGQLIIGSTGLGVHG